MNQQSLWNASKSMWLSRAITVGFAVALVVVDVFGVPFVEFVSSELISVNHGLLGGYALLACLYLCSIPAYVLLYSLYRLLRNLEEEDVFIAQNVLYLRRVSWCCVAAALVCLACASVWSSLAIVALAAAFMALIVRVVKNVFEQAILMKDELDFTI